MHGAGRHARGKDQALPARRARGGGRGHRHRPQRQARRAPRSGSRQGVVRVGARRLARPRPHRRGLRRAPGRHRRRARRPVKLLLDTHAALWWLSGDERFGTTAEEHLSDTTNQVLLSAAVVWEVAIKRSLGKLEAPEDLAQTLVGGGAHPLPVGLDHAAAVERLPWHHRDPFDRLLVAQAIVERAPAPASLARTEVAAARVGRYVYVMGGFERDSGATTAATERYDIERDRWTRMADMPAALNHAAAAAYKRRVYVLGGYRARTGLNREV